MQTEQNFLSLLIRCPAHPHSPLSTYHSPWGKANEKAKKQRVGVSVWLLNCFLFGLCWWLHMPCAHAMCASVHLLVCKLLERGMKARFGPVVVCLRQEDSPNPLTPSNINLCRDLPKRALHTYIRKYRTCILPSATPVV